MGRYYTGDIEGKFWFGLQPSNDADFFGSAGYEPNYLNYYYESDEIPLVEEGIKKCKKELGDWKKIIDDFFKSVNGWNDQIVIEHGLDLKTFNQKLEWYARLELGEKILKCLKEKGECSFQAEL